MNRPELVGLQIVRLLVRLRATIGGITGNTDVVDRLTGPEGRKRAQRISDFILAELGEPEAVKRQAATLKAAAKAQLEPVTPDPKDSTGAELKGIAVRAMSAAGM